jgi:hypothetical protein
LSRLIPEGFVTFSEAAQLVAIALTGGIPDRDAVRLLKEKGNDVADGAAFDEAIRVLWAAVDRGKLQSFAVGPKGKGPLKLAADVSKAIPLLRSPRGGTLSYLRPRNPNFKAFAEWFGPDLSDVSVVFREAEVAQLARKQLQVRRRKQTQWGKVARAVRPGRSRSRGQFATSLTAKSGPRRSP